MSSIRTLELVHLVSQHGRGQGRTNIYIFHDLRTAHLEVQDQHKMAVLKPQETQDNEEAVQQETEEEQSGFRTSSGVHTSNEEPVHERFFTHSAVFSTAKERVLRSLAGQQTPAFRPTQHYHSPPGSKEQQGKPAEGRKKGIAQTHQLVGGRFEPPVWLSGYIVDFSREFHDEAATASNITRAAHLFERAGMDTEAFIGQIYAARRITKGRANIQKRAEVGKNPAWPTGFPNRMPYFFSVLEERLGVKAVQ